MNAVIYLDVPKWQIGQDVMIYFPDTMQKKGTCELLKEQEPVKPKQHLVYTTKGWFCGVCDGRINRAGRYCAFCGRAVKWE